MNIYFTMIFNALLLGVGLAMDAFSVSLANGLHEPKMQKRRMLLIAGTFGAFQFIMPVIGWACVHYIAEAFNVIYKYVPFVAFALLLFIGGKMLIEGMKGGESDEEATKVTFKGLMVQGVATSIDALSVGFTTADYSVLRALCSSIIIGVVTLAICIVGLILGKKVGMKLANKASILGGCVLIAIGLEQLIQGITNFR